MSQTFTPEQIEKLRALGISTTISDEKNMAVTEETLPVETEVSIDTPIIEPESLPTKEESPSVESEPLKYSLPVNGGVELIETESLNSTLETKDKKGSVIPLLSISGLTVLSFGGLIIFKSKNTAIVPPSPSQPNSSSQQASQLSPTQVPKSIQHYLLTSQQNFSQALQQQQGSASTTNTNSTLDLLNQSIIAATQAIKEFPQDYRGYYQRGKIYQSLSDSKPDFLNQSIADLTTAQKLEPTSADITRDLANIFAKKGDAQSTIFYLSQTISIDPTKAQNFYDLAKIQQQVGLMSQALDTYNRLLPLISDPQQLTQVQSEKAALENLVAQNPNQNPTIDTSSPTQNNIPSNIDSPTIQATDITNTTGLIIAAPETAQKIEVSNKTDSNSLSGSGTIPANQKEITINNSNLSSASQVYATLTKGGKNQTLKVLSKSETSFVVGFDSALSETVEFKWWIIN